MSYQPLLLKREPRKSPFWRVVLLAAALLFATATLYVLVVALPNRYVPTAVELHPFKRVTNVTYSEPTLDANSAGKHRKHRLIVVGDIHGMYREFKHLMAKVEFNPKKDKLMVVGDFITKGPRSFDVLDYLIKVKADCVIGNHEWSVLNLYTQYHRLPTPYFEDWPQPPVPETNSREFAIAKKLQPHHIEFLNNCSVIKRLGYIKSADTVGVAVHAGLRWELALHEQPPLENLEMRSYLNKPWYNETTSDPSEPGAKLWSKVYNQKMSENPKSAKVVFYGHDAGRGLKLKHYTRGIDTGCVKGGKLTAVVIGHAGEEEVVQVKC